jgi:FMN phosphatase YigB (HAD superfamily)
VLHGCDNPKLDVLPALEAGLRTILIDRDETYIDVHGRLQDLEMEKLGVRAIRNLKEMPSNLR